MTSKNLYFKLLKEDFKIRLWTFVVSCLTFFFTLIVATAMMISNYSDDFNYMMESSVSEPDMMRLVGVYKDYIGVNNLFLAFIFTVLAILVAISGFSYLYSKKKVDLYHSLPVKRETLFFIKTINSILIVLVPFTVSAVISLLIISANVADVGLALAVFTAIAQWSILFIFNYLVVILAVMFTGNMLIGTLACFFFYFYFPFFSFLIMGYQKEFFETYYSSGFILEKIWANMSSIFIMFNISNIGVAQSVIIAAVGSVVLFFADLLLYKKRSSESAGKSQAFNITKLPIKFMTVIFLSMLMYLVSYQIMNDSIYWGIFGAVVSALITHCTMEIIYNQDFKKIFARKIEMLICLVISLVFIAIFQWDILGYDRYLPKADDVESVAVISDILENNITQYYYKMKVTQYPGSPDIAETEYVDSTYIDKDLMKRMNIEDKDAVLDLAQKCIEGTMDVDDNYYMDVDDNYYMDVDDNYYIGGGEFQRVLISYKLKSGRSVQREYYMNYRSIAEQLGEIYDGENFKKTIYPILSEDAADIVSVDYNGIGNDDKHIMLKDKAIKAKLIETYKKELTEFKFEERVESYPFASIRFNDKAMQKALDVDLGSLKRDGIAVENIDTAYVQSMNSVGYYPLYPEFSETIALLRELGADVLEKMPAQDIDRIEIFYDVEGIKEDTDGKDNYVSEHRNVVISDEIDIEKVLDKLIFETTPYNDYDFNIDDRISVYVYMKDDSDTVNSRYDVSYSFRKGDLPDNLKYILDEIE